MAQFIFFTLFIMVLLAGIFHRFSHHHVYPMNFKPDTSASGLPDQSSQTTTIQQANMTTSQGVMKISQQVNHLAQQQDGVAGMLQNQQQVLNNAINQASLLMQAGNNSEPDILKMNALLAQFQDQSRLLVGQGQDLLAMNDQITKNRQAIQDQMNLAALNSDAESRALQDRYQLLENQSKMFLDQVTARNQEIEQRIDQMQADLNGITPGSSSSSIEKAEDFLKNSQTDLTVSQQRVDDMVARSQEMIQEASQRAEDEEQSSQQRTDDLMQRLKDRENR